MGCPGTAPVTPGSDAAEQLGRTVGKLVRVGDLREQAVRTEPSETLPDRHCTGALRMKKMQPVRITRSLNGSSWEDSHLTIADGSKRDFPTGTNGSREYKSVVHLITDNKKASKGSITDSYHAPHPKFSRFAYPRPDFQPQNQVPSHAFYSSAGNL